jgi:hypothetical protein
MMHWHGCSLHTVCHIADVVAVQLTLQQLGLFVAIAWLF